MYFRDPRGGTGPFNFGGAQGVQGLPLPPPSGMPVMPRKLPSGRFRAVQGVTEAFDESAFCLLNGELVFPVGTSSVLLLPQASALRNFLGFRNSSSAAVEIYIAFGVEATLNSWLRLTQNTIALLDTRVPQDSIYAICSAAGGQVTLVQSTTTGVIT
jgi:hypothetical protein